MKKLLNPLLVCVSITLLLSSCDSSSIDKSKPSLNKKQLSLYVEESSLLEYTGGDCEWTSENPLIASVKNGLVTANHVGKTIIYANNLTCDILVKPKYTKYYEPYTKWGESNTNVKKHMSKYELQKENENQLLYKGDSHTLSYFYSFENGVLTGSGFAVELGENDYLIDYIFERYIPISSDKTTFVFASPDKKTVVGIKITIYNIMVAYVPYDLSKSKDLPNADEIFKSLE